MEYAFHATCYVHVVLVQRPLVVNSDAELVFRCRYDSEFLREIRHLTVHPYDEVQDDVPDMAYFFFGEFRSIEISGSVCIFFVVAFDNQILRFEYRNLFRVHFA